VFPCGWWEREAGADRTEKSPHAAGFTWSWRCSIRDKGGCVPGYCYDLGRHLVRHAGLRTGITTTQMARQGFPSPAERGASSSMPGEWGPRCSPLELRARQDGRGCGGGRPRRATRRRRAHRLRGCVPHVVRAASRGTWRAARRRRDGSDRKGLSGAPNWGADWGSVWRPHGDSNRRLRRESARIMVNRNK
jgi:hypothetical protein